MTEDQLIQDLFRGWHAQPELLECSPVTQGILVRLLSLLCLPQRVAWQGSAANLARSCSATYVEVQHALSELRRVPWIEVRTRIDPPCADRAPSGAPPPATELPHPDPADSVHVTVRWTALAELRHRQNQARNRAKASRDRGRTPAAEPAADQRATPTSARAAAEPACAKRAPTVREACAAGGAPLFFSEEESFGVVNASEKSPKPSIRKTQKNPTREAAAGGACAKRARSVRRWATPEDPPLPPELADPASGFPAAWAARLAEREERGRPMTPTAAARELMRAKAMGAAAACEAIDSAIGGGWPRLYPPDASRSRPTYRNGVAPHAPHRAAKAAREYAPSGPIELPDARVRKPVG